MSFDSTILNEPRFSQPANWRWHFFRSSSGHKIRFGSVFPKDKIPDAVVLCLPGFREFGEKYFELAHDMLGRNFAFWILDWGGQGLSDRYLADPHKVHSLGMDKHVADLKQFIFDYVKPASVHPDVGRLPVILAGHSMGGHLGLRYLHDNPENFIKAAAFTAPLVRIRQFAPYPGFLSSLLCRSLQFMASSYIPGGEKAAELARQCAPGKGLYSSDPIRDQLHNLWFDHKTELQVKGPTYKWLYDVVQSCNVIQKKSFLRNIETPVLLGIAENDYIVSSKAIRQLGSRLPSCEIVSLPAARHEIFMEKDEIRNQFLSHFDNFIHKHILSRQDRLQKF